MISKAETRLKNDFLAKPYRPFPIRALNALGRGLARFGQTPISLRDEELMGLAVR